MNVFNEYATTGIDYRTFRVLTGMVTGIEPSDDQLAVPDSPYMRALYAQFMFETGNGKSRLFVEYNNMYGMRPARIRPKFYVDEATTSNGDFAIYDNVSASIADRLDLDRYNVVASPRTENEVLQYYISILDKGYAPENTYLNGVIGVYNNLFDGLDMGTLENYSDLYKDGEEVMGNQHNSYFGLSPLTLGLVGLGIGTGIYFYTKNKSK